MFSPRVIPTLVREYEEEKLEERQIAAELGFTPQEFRIRVELGGGPPASLKVITARADLERHLFGLMGFLKIQPLYGLAVPQISPSFNGGTHFTPPLANEERPNSYDSFGFEEAFRACERQQLRLPYQREFAAASEEVKRSWKHWSVRGYWTPSVYVRQDRALVVQAILTEQDRVVDMPLCVHVPNSASSCWAAPEGFKVPSTNDELRALVNGLYKLDRVYIAEKDVPAVSLGALCVHNPEVD